MCVNLIKRNKTTSISINHMKKNRSLFKKNKEKEKEKENKTMILKSQ